jgi:hypothetical protein
MTTITFRHGAAEYERFAPGAFDFQIGTTLRVNLPSGPREGALKAAEVAEDGLSVELTVDIGERLEGST